jgi:hypothetical protein
MFIASRGAFNIADQMVSMVSRFFTIPAPTPLLCFKQFKEVQQPALLNMRTRVICCIRVFNVYLHPANCVDIFWRGGSTYSNQYPESDTLGVINCPLTPMLRMLSKALSLSSYHTCFALLFNCVAKYF